jgi:hypothetical protein
LIPLRLKDPISSRVPLNRKTKKENDLLSMINFSKIDFSVDFNFDEQIQKTIKIEEIKQQQEDKKQKEKDNRGTRIRAGS